MTYRFDGFHLDPATRELRQDGELVALPARAFDCLAYLIEHRDRAVGRDELIAAVWGRTEISDALLSHTVVKIRRCLGDTGNEQRTIRTVPRFGYRWIGVLASPDAEVAAPAPSPEALPSPGAPEAPVSAAGGPVADTPSPPSGPLAMQAAPRAWRARFALVLACLVLVAGCVAVWLQRAPGEVPVAIAPAAGEPADVMAAPALVLPAEVVAPDEWRWLRFGLMDLVATRLRDGALPTLPSEVVVGLLRQPDGAADADLLHGASFVRVATLRVLPHVRFEQGHWHVRLEAAGAQRSLEVEAQADDAIRAARDAADLLLRKLGHVSSGIAGEPASPQLDELLQRSGAAMLADQLDQARALIEHAPAELQRQPRVEHRLAQLDLRAGDYAAVATRLLPLLDRLSPQREAALRARVLITLAVVDVRRGETDKAAELYEEAIALRQGQSDPEVLGIAWLGRGAVLLRNAQYAEATAELSRARIELAAAGDGLGIASVDVNLGGVQLQQHRPADALPLLQTAARAFERLGAREGRAYALAQQARAESELLDFDAALATTERFWPPEAHTSNLRLRGPLSVARAQALIGLGRLDAAQALLAPLLADADFEQDQDVRAQAAAHAAVIAWRSGDTGATVRRAAQAMTAVLRDADEGLHARTALLQAGALRRLGRAAEADAALQLLQARTGGDWRAMYGALAAAEQAHAAGRSEAALAQFTAARRVAERFNVPGDLVTVAAPQVAALIEAGQLDEARGVAGRIAPWAERDPRAAAAQARLFRALGQEDAARRADAVVLRLAAGWRSSGMSELP